MHKRFQLVGCLIVIGLVAITLIFGDFRKSVTEDLILKSHRACEAQTGQDCTVP